MNNFQGDTTFIPTNKDEILGLDLSAFNQTMSVDTSNDPNLIAIMSKDTKTMKTILTSRLNKQKKILHHWSLLQMDAALEALTM